MSSRLSPLLIEPLKVEQITVAIADLSPSLQGIKIVQLSDFHYDGTSLSEQILREVVVKTNQENPDLIILTGDYITTHPQPIWRLILRLKEFHSRFGIYAVLGNHDCYYPLSKTMVSNALESINIKVLCNQIVTPLGDQLPIIGLADYWSNEFDPDPILSQIDPKIPRLVLCHNPDTAEILAKWRVDLQLSGHTHGGQLALPFLGTFPSILTNLRPYIPPFIQQMIPIWKECSHVVKNWQWAQGLHSIGHNLLYVNRGLGSYFPGRLFCPPELTVITLKKAH
ncbi:MAG: metallophosphoesterase [Microcystaceae cyanobacterium]